MMPINIITVIVLATGAITGLRKGLISQLGQLAAFIIGAVACRIAGHQAAAWLIGESTSPESMLCGTIAGYMLVFAVVYGIVRAIAAVLKMIAHAVCLGLIDRIAGALFNMFKWMFALSLVLNVWVMIFPDSELVRDPDLPIAGRVLNFAPRVIGSDTARQLLGIDGDNAGPAESDVKH